MRQWVSYTTRNKPFRDRTGEILDDLNGLRNRRGEKFSGGGKSYPELNGVVCTFEKGNTFYALVEGEEFLTGGEFKGKAISFAAIFGLLTAIGLPVIGIDEETLEPIFAEQA